MKEETVTAKNQEENSIVAITTALNTQYLLYVSRYLGSQLILTCICRLGCIVAGSVTPEALGLRPVRSESSPGWKYVDIPHQPTHNLT